MQRRAALIGSLWLRPKSASMRRVVGRPLTRVDASPCRPLSNKDVESPSCLPKGVLLKKIRPPKWTDESILADLRDGAYKQEYFCSVDTLVRGRVRKA